jgi:hypothetical protein
MLFQRAIVHIILMFPSLQPPITDMASFVFISTVRVKFVVTIKPGPTKPTVRMTLESALINCSWIIITESFMLTKFLHGEEIVFVGENLFVPCA